MSKLNGGSSMSECVNAGELLRKLDLEMLGFAPRETILTAYRYASRWLETKTPYWIDKAVCEVDRVNAPCPPTLFSIIADVADKRLKGVVFPGTPGQVRREESEQMALVLMASAVAQGHTIKRASIVASSYLTEVKCGDLKASTLEKLYNDRGKSLVLLFNEELVQNFLKDNPGIGKMLMVAFGELPVPADLGERR